MIKNLLLTNTVFSFGGIIGAGVWQYYNDIYTLTNAYEFFWFVTITSFIIGITGYLFYRDLHHSKDNLLFSLLVSFISLLYTIFWLSCSATIARYLRECVYIKDKLNSIYFDDNYNYTCNGEIITTIFGFANFFVWAAICYFLFLSLYNIHDITNSYRQNNDIEMSLPQEEPQQSEPQQSEPAPEPQQSEPAPEPQQSEPQQSEPEPEPQQSEPEPQQPQQPQQSEPEPQQSQPVP